MGRVNPAYPFTRDFAGKSGYHYPFFDPDLFGSFQGVNLHCICQRVYSPNLDSQRYCKRCDEWFHSRCLGEPQTTTRMSGSLIQQLLKAPICRGWTSSPPEDWMTVGSGRLYRKIVATSKLEGPHDWEELLGSSFLLYVTEGSADFEFFKCPQCSGLI